MLVEIGNPNYHEDYNKKLGDVPIEARKGLNYGRKTNSTSYEILPDEEP